MPPIRLLLVQLLAVCASGAASWAFVPSIMTMVTGMTMAAGVPGSAERLVGIAGVAVPLTLLIVAFLLLPTLWVWATATRSRWAGLAGTFAGALCFGMWLGVRPWRGPVLDHLPELAAGCVILWLTFGDRAVASWWLHDSGRRGRPLGSLPRGSGIGLVVGTVLVAAAFAWSTHPDSADLAEFGAQRPDAKTDPAIEGAFVEEFQTRRRLSFPSLGIEMMEVPGGELTANRLGFASDSGWGQAKLSVAAPFWLATTEVTVGLYAAASGTGFPRSHADGDDLPQEDVTWWEAARFCNRLSKAAGLSAPYRFTVGTESVDDFADEATPTEVVWDTAATGFRLPTDGEWVAAALAGTRDRPTRHPSGCRNANMLDVSGLGTFTSRWSLCDDESARASRVAWYRSDKLGFYDLFGNVAEWTWGEAREDEPLGELAKALTTTRVSPDFAAESAVDDSTLHPAWFTTSAPRHNARGGSWADLAADVTVLTHRPELATARLETVGFRVALGGGQRPAVIETPPVTLTISLEGENVPAEREAPDSKE